MTTTLRQIPFGAGETVVIDGRRVLGPLSFLPRATTGRGSIAASFSPRPGTVDWFEPWPDFSAAGVDITRTVGPPAPWLRFKMEAMARGHADFAFDGMITVHRTGAHTLAAGMAFAALAIAREATARVYLPRGFDYSGPFGSLHYALVSDTPAVATVTLDDDDAIVTGVAAGMANIAVTATAPIGLTAAASIAVTVT